MINEGGIFFKKTFDGQLASLVEWDLQSAVYTFFECSQVSAVK
jgi:hypothetical protein